MDNDNNVHASQHLLNLPDFDQNNTAEFPIPDESDSSSSSSADPGEFTYYSLFYHLLSLLKMF